MRDIKPIFVPDDAEYKMKCRKNSPLNGRRENSHQSIHHCFVFSDHQVYVAVLIFALMSFDGTVNLKPSIDAVNFLLTSADTPSILKSLTLAVTPSTFCCV